MLMKSRRDTGHTLVQKDIPVFQNNSTIKSTILQQCCLFLDIKVERISLTVDLRLFYMKGCEQKWAELKCCV